MKRFRMAIFAPLCAFVTGSALVGCGDGKAEAEAKRQAKREVRAESTARKLAAPAAMRKHASDEGDLIQITFPVETFGIVEKRTCFVWRDKEFRTSMMQCPGPPEIDLE